MTSWAQGARRDLTKKKHVFFQIKRLGNHVWISVIFQLIIPKWKNEGVFWKSLVPLECRNPVFFFLCVCKRKYGMLWLKIFHINVSSLESERNRTSVTCGSDCRTWDFPNLLELMELQRNCNLLDDRIANQRTCTFSKQFYICNPATCLNGTWSTTDIRCQRTLCDNKHSMKKKNAQLVQSLKLLRPLTK